MLTTTTSARLGVMVLGMVVWCCLANNPTDVVVQDLKIFVNGKEFFVKGMAYNPTPLGKLQMSASGQGGTGLCSPRLNYLNQNVSACWIGQDDSEYADVWFKPLWDRDFPLLRELGTNTLRLYHTSQYTELYIQQYQGKDPNIKTNIGASHVEFLDMAYEWGFKVIYPILCDEATLSSNTDEQIDIWIKSQIDEVGYHPAILMWAFGNELNLIARPELLTLLNNKFDVIRNYTLQKWSRVVPVTSAVVDLPDSYATLAASMKVDVFTSNAGYRGPDFSDLWSGNAAQSVPGWKQLSQQYNLPLLIGELGWPIENNQMDYILPTWFNSKWRDLVLHTDDGCVGGVFFEYSDEPTKVDPAQKTMGVVNFTVNTLPDGRSSTDKGVLIADTATRKDIIFNAVAKGTYQGEAWNMNSNVFTLLGREQATIPGDWDVEFNGTTTGLTSTTTGLSSTTTTGMATTTTGDSTTTTTDLTETSSAAALMQSVLGVTVCVLAVLLV